MHVKKCMVLKNLLHLGKEIRCLLLLLIFSLFYTFNNNKTDEPGAFLVTLESICESCTNFFRVEA